MKSLAALGLVLVFGCSDDSPQMAAKLYPDDYAATFTEVRNCRYSIEHSLVNIRVLASPDAVAAYQDRVDPFLTDAIIVKEEYAEDDMACAGTIEAITVMKKLPFESSPSSLDWLWQRVYTNGPPVVEPDDEDCIRCHTDCGVAPMGYAGTCTVP